LTDAGSVPPSPEAKRLALAQDLLAYRFNRPALLREALTHRSAAHGRRRHTGSNERLEFIGDRVLGLVIAEWLVQRFPKEQEGDLGPRHAYLVSREALADIGVEIGFSRVLSLGSSEASAGVASLANVLADALEAAIGAIFLDSGLDAARAFVRRAWAGAIDRQVLPPKDAKTALQEWFLARGKALPRYDVLSSEGPSHAPQFVITVTGGNQTGRGEAGTKRAAEREAAADLMRKLK
jgi:ribonuclease-3